MNSSIEELEKRIVNIENDFESFFSTFLNQRSEKKCIIELLEDAIVDHFQITKKDFKFIELKKDGKASRSLAIENKDIVEARKWMIILSKFILLKTSGSLKIEYPWYSARNEWNYRRIFTAALEPKTKEDLKNRETFLSISGHIRKNFTELYQKMQLDLI